MKEKLNYKRTILVGFAFLSISAFWELYDNIIPLMLQNTFGLKETLTGVIMALDNVYALFLLPLFGTWSDKVETRLGKRTPFIVVGTLLAVTFLVMLPVADYKFKLSWFILALFGVLFAMGIYRSPAIALMPDVTPNHLRSKANAVINLMGAIGGVFTLAMVILLVNTEGRADYRMLFFSVGALMLVSILLLVLTVHENEIAKEMEEKGSEKTEEKRSLDKSKLSTMERINLLMEKEGDMSKAVKRSLTFLLLSIFFWFMGYNAVTTAFSRYTQVVWGLEESGFADCLLVATVAAIISYIPVGILSTKIGRKKSILLGLVLMAACFFVAIFVNSYQYWIIVPFACIGFAWAAIGVNSYPMIVAMSTGADIGKYTGTYYTFSMAAQIATPVISGYLLENVSYKTLFPYAFLCVVIAIFTMSRVSHGDVKAEKKESLLEHFNVED